MNLDNIGGTATVIATAVGAVLSAFGFQEWVKYRRDSKTKKEGRAMAKEDDIDSFYKRQYDDLYMSYKDLSLRHSKEVSKHIETKQRLKIALTLIDETQNTDLVNILRDE